MSACWAKDSRKWTPISGLNGGSPSGQHLAEGQVDGGVGAAGQVEGDLDQRLVERVHAAGEATDAGLVAERLLERLPEDDADVLDGVVAVDVEVAGGLHGEVEAAVAAELVEHVVEERQARW